VAEGSKIDLPLSGVKVGLSMATDSSWLRITIWPPHYFADEPYMEEQIKFNSGPDFFDGFYRRTDVPVDGRATWILECHSDLEGRPGRQVSFNVPTFLRFHAKTGQWVLGRGIGVGVRSPSCNIMTLSDYAHVEEPSDLPSTKWIEKDFKRPVARTVQGLLGRLDCGPLVPARNEDDLVVTIKKIDLQVGTHQLSPEERSHLLADYKEDQFQVRPGMKFPTFPVGFRSNLPHLVLPCPQKAPALSEAFMALNDGKSDHTLHEVIVITSPHTGGSGPATADAQ